MDSKKVCFICCTNDLMYEKECRLYIEHLIIPEEMQIEINMVYRAESMASGYNRAMRESDAKYKVYLHQDVFLLNCNFISDMLKVFENEQVGIFGVAGCTELPENGIAYMSWNQGRLKTNTSLKAFDMTMTIEKQEEDVMVTAVDGLLIATQYDLPWREDLFDGWDFYDISQALEFKKAGYLIKVPKQETSWCMHDDGFPNLRYYEYYRRIFVREYGAFLKGKNSISQVPFDEGLQNAVHSLKEKLIQLFNKGEYGEIYTYLCENCQVTGYDTDLALLGIFMQIWVSEQNQKDIPTFFKKNITWEDANMKYQKHKFWLYEMEFGIGNGEQQIVSEMSQNIVSANALFVLIMHNSIEKEKILGRFAKIYQKIGNFNNAERFIREAFKLIEETKKISYLTW